MDWFGLDMIQGVGVLTDPKDIESASTRANVLSVPLPGLERCESLLTARWQSDSHELCALFARCLVQATYDIARHGVRFASKVNWLCMVARPLNSESVKKLRQLLGKHDLAAIQLTPCMAFASLRLQAANQSMPLLRICLQYNIRVGLPDVLIDIGSVGPVASSEPQRHEHRIVICSSASQENATTSGSNEPNSDGSSTSYISKVHVILHREMLIRRMVISLRAYHLNANRGSIIGSRTCIRALDAATLNLQRTVDHLGLAMHLACETDMQWYCQQVTQSLNIVIRWIRLLTATMRDTRQRHEAFQHRVAELAWIVAGSAGHAYVERGAGTDKIQMMVVDNTLDEIRTISSAEKQVMKWHDRMRMCAETRMRNCQKIIAMAAKRWDDHSRQSDPTWQTLIRCFSRTIGDLADCAVDTTDAGSDDSSIDATAVADGTVTTRPVSGSAIDCDITFHDLIIPRDKPKTMCCAICQQSFDWQEQTYGLMCDHERICRPCLQSKVLPSSRTCGRCGLNTAWITVGDRYQWVVTSETIKRLQMRKPHHLIMNQIIGLSKQINGTDDVRAFEQWCGVDPRTRETNIRFLLGSTHVPLQTRTKRKRSEPPVHHPMNIVQCFSRPTVSDVDALHRTRDSQWTRMLKPDKQRQCPSGLANINSSCYANSLLQVCFACPPFRAALSRESREEAPGFALLRQLCAQVHYGPESVVYPYVLVSLLRSNENVCADSIDDPMVALDKMLNCTELFGCNLQRLFELTLVESCSRDGHETNVCDQHNVLMLTLTERGSTIRSLLDKYSCWDVTDQKNVTTRSVIEETGDILVLQVGRWANSVHGSQINRWRVKVETTLRPCPQSTYSLQSVIVVIPGQQYGSVRTDDHYRALVRKGDTWYCCDDVKVTKAQRIKQDSSGQWFQAHGRELVFCVVYVAVEKESSDDQPLIAVAKTYREEMLSRLSCYLRCRAYREAHATEWQRRIRRAIAIEDSSGNLPHYWVPRTWLRELFHRPDGQISPPDYQSIGCDQHGGGVRPEDVRNLAIIPALLLERFVPTWENDRQHYAVARKHGDQKLHQCCAECWKLSTKLVQTARQRLDAMTRLKNRIGKRKPTMTIGPQHVIALRRKIYDEMIECSRKWPWCFNVNINPPRAVRDANDPTSCDHAKYVFQGKPRRCTEAQKITLERFVGKITTFPLNIVECQACKKEQQNMSRLLTRPNKSQ